MFYWSVVTTVPSSKLCCVRVLASGLEMPGMKVIRKAGSLAPEGGHYGHSTKWK